MEAFMPIRRSKSVLVDLYRRINRLSRNNGAGEILSRGSRIFSLALPRKNQRPKPGDPKREQKKIAPANKYD